MRAALFGTGTATVEIGDRTITVDFDYDLEEFGCGIGSLGMEAEDGEEISDAEEAAVLAEVERQLTDRAQGMQAATKQEVEGIKLEALRTIMGGGSIKDMDPFKREKLGTEGISSVLAFEKSWNSGSNESDPATYYKLSMMSGEELHSMGPDLIDYAGKLSKEDLKGFIDKAGNSARGEDAAKRSTDLSRTQIVTSTQNMLGLDPSKTPADAERMAAFNRALDVKINGFIAANGGKEPDGTQMQAMADDLMMKGNLDQWGKDPEKRAFELTPGEIDNFYVADEYSDIPAELTRPGGVIPRGYSTIWRSVRADSDPDEGEAVAFYNDMMRVKAGGAPTPPDELAARIRQGLAQTTGAMPSDDQVAAFYREWIIRATK